MSYQIRRISNDELNHFSTRQEDHFFDRKSAQIRPAKLSQTFSSLANADGGEIFVGLEDDGTFKGFASIEDANPTINVAADVLSQRYYRVEFVTTDDQNRYGALFTIERHPALITSSAGEVYQRHGAHNRRLQGDDLETLKRSKGEVRYELTSTSATLDEPRELDNHDLVYD